MLNKIRQCLLDVIKSNGPISSVNKVNAAAQKIAGVIRQAEKAPEPAMKLPKVSVEVHESSAIVNGKLVINPSEVIIVKMLAEELGLEYEVFNG